MARSASSASSLTSSSAGRSSTGLPPSYSEAYASPGNSTFSSAVSAVTSVSSAPPTTPLHPLDLGPPGYQATIVLFEHSNEPRTVYLGPWQLETTEPRCIMWQCSYQGETLEHFLPSGGTIPYVSHALHRQYSDPCDVELSVSFRRPHRVRYIASDGAVLHDEHMVVKYEFTSNEGSYQFQGDIRGKDLVDFFDVDVVWSDTHGRTNSFGAVSGLCAIQRMKMWRDRHSGAHSITFLANRRDNRDREYLVSHFDGLLGGRDEHHRRVRLNARNRRASTPASSHSRRFSSSSLFRPRQQSTSSSSSSSQPPSNNNAGPRLDIRYLGVQFSRKEDYLRFFEQWATAHSSDHGESAVTFPDDHVELPSSQTMPANHAPFATPAANGNSLHTVPEPTGPANLGEAP